MKVSVYLRDDYIRKDKTAPLHLRTFIGGRYLFIPLDINVAPENWDKEKNLITDGPDKRTQNNLIKKALGEASQIILKYQFNKKALTRELFLKEFKNPCTLTDFYAYMEDQIKIRIGEITQKTANKQLSHLNKLRDFQPGGCLMTELDELFIRNFEKYLKRRGNNENTLASTLRTIRTYINRAIKDELMQNSPFRYYKIKRVKTYPEFVTEEELQILHDLYKSNRLPETYKNVLRWFLFVCQTGLRISDLRSMQHEHVRNKTLVFRPIKTANVNNKRIEVPLTSIAMQLIKDESATRIKGNIFDCISEQKMNKYIKGVFAAAKVEKKKISFHMARHTFATLFLKRSKKANGLLILKELLGHSSIETTMIYSHVLQEDIEEAIQDFDLKP